ncbi:ACS family MFS transporter [Sphingobium sp. SA916]|uniref:ACS family MFS transporter n=1 Tax=Sphingobium sp. SA916 TaxID=1851207 RepID=UPI000C9F589A|nr:ACS family MFS transporter [Sphingobium sp. SA916]PNP96701.1 hypothetical protein A8G00_23155 [Sphingobium sp. SA916]
MTRSDPRISKRAIIVLMCFLAMLICYIDRVSMSTGVVAMAEEFGWSNTERGWVLSAFFGGYLVAQIPGGWITNRFGGRLVMGISLLWWSLMTMVTPLAAFGSVALLIVTRIAMGVGEAAVTSCIYNLASRWLLPHERSRAMTVMIGGIPMGTLIALLTSTWLIQTWSWPAMFYAFGLLGFVFALFWFRIVHATPREDPAISLDERALLASADTASAAEASAADRHVPWAKLLKSPSVWALITNHFCSNWSLYILLGWLPSYFRRYSELGIGSVGLYSALPWLLLFIVGNLAGLISDRLIRRGWSIVCVRKTMQAIGLVGSAAGLAIASFVTTPLAAVVALCFSLGLLGFTWAGFGPNHLDIAPRHADVLAGLTNTAGTLPGVIGVILTGIIIDISGSFALVFQISVIINLIGVAIWLRWASGKPVVT